jgi:hypothetical protein
VLEAVLAHAVVERRAVDAEGARRVGDVALGLIDGGHDLVALLLGQTLVQRTAALPGNPPLWLAVTGAATAPEAMAWRRPKSRSAGVSTSEVARIRARSITFSSSRTLPGQG